MRKETGKGSRFHICVDEDEVGAMLVHFEESGLWRRFWVFEGRRCFLFVHVSVL